MAPEAREPTLAEKARREALLKEYGEVCSTFRILTDIRFKLLGLLPIAAAIGAAFKPEGTAPSRIPFALFGLLVTLAVMNYNLRNDQLYDELVGRARAIEQEIGIPDGAFATRPNAWLSYGVGPIRWGVNHRFSVGLIYLTTTALWLYLAGEGAGAIMARTPWGREFLREHLRASLLPHIGILGRFAIALGAFFITYVAQLILKRCSKTTDTVLRKAIGQAAHLIENAEFKLQNAMKVEYGSQITGRPAPTVPTSALLAAFVSDDAADEVRPLLRESPTKRALFIESCVKARSPATQPSKDDLKKLQKSVDHLAAADETTLLRLVRGASGNARNAHLLALLVGQPPRWVQEVAATNKPS